MVCSTLIKVLTLMFVNVAQFLEGLANQDQYRELIHMLVTDNCRT